MELGIFSRTFPSGSLDSVLAAIRDEGILLAHFNLASAGVESLPSEIPPVLAETIQEAFSTFGLRMVGISGTYNTIHPDMGKRREETRRCINLIQSAPKLGTHFVSLCTGSRDAENMWRAHPDNSTPSAWKDLRATLDLLLEAAEQSNVILGIEPEFANVIDSAPRARKLLDEVSSAHLKIVLDAANLVHPNQPEQLSPILREALDLLAGDVVMVHAKDLAPEGESDRQSAGTGLLDFDLYFNLLREYLFDGPVVLHNLRPDQVQEAASFVKVRMERHTA